MYIKKNMKWKVKIMYLHIIIFIEKIFLLPFNTIWYLKSVLTIYEIITNILLQNLKYESSNRKRNCTKTRQNGVKMSHCDFLRLCSFPWVMRQLLLENAVINFGLIARNSSHFHTPQWNTPLDNTQSKQNITMR